MAGRPRKIAPAYEAYATADAIRVAAEDLCGEMGVSRVRIREIARRVGIEAASIYNHYDGLDGLLAAMARNALQEIAGVYDRVAGMDGAAAVRAICSEQVHMLARRKGIARLVLADLAEEQGHSALNANEDLIVEINRREFEIYRGMADLSDRKDLRRFDVTNAKLGMMLSLLSVRWMGVRDIPESGVDDIADMTAEFVLSYLASRGETAGI